MPTDETAEHDREPPYKACADTGPRGFCCEEPRGHDGEHTALDGDYTWENNDD
jgi:hypothetical protein